MPRTPHSPVRPTQRTPQATSLATNHPAVLPLGALLLAGSLSAMAQTSTEASLPTVTVKEQAEPAEIKDKTTLRATSTTIGKGQQAIRDIPQTVTVMTEMLINDRNLDDFREVLKTTAGVTFLAGETGEEDVRMRGFSLAQAGDIYRDGMRDAPLIERDTFNSERVEVLKGSASMLFGKGSTGGVVNQVSKRPFLLDQNEVNTTIGSGREFRVTGDFNFQTGEDSAFRLNAMTHVADNHGADVTKEGLAPSYRWGIGTRDEFEVGFYHLKTESTPVYFFRPLTSNGYIVPLLDADKYYGLQSDYLNTKTNYVNFIHKHRFDQDSELTTRVRAGHYERDLLASPITLGQTNGATTTLANFGPNTILNRQSKGRRAESDVTQIASDYTTKFDVLGKKHSLIAGVDLTTEDAKRNNNAANSGTCYRGSVALANCTTTVGTPNNGTTRPDNRTIRMTDFGADSLGLYVQDTVSLNDTLKLVAGLRFDHFKASYHDLNNNSADMSENLWSPRLGMLYQPDATSSYYASFGTSYNTSGDTYQYAVGTTFNEGSTNQALANTPAEKSRNLEVGGKFDVFDDKATLGAAWFYSEKYNERNGDPLAGEYLLSGKRHATGFEFNAAGRLLPAWDIFFNHTWIPSAKIDKTVATGIRQGFRPGLTPRHSGSLWTTYRVLPQWRVGFGLNYRSEQVPLTGGNTRAKAFATADAMVEYTINERYTVKLNVTNLTDKLYADALYSGGAYIPGTARTVQLNLKALF